MNFKTKIEYYVGSTDGYIDAEAIQYIIDGCYDVYRKIKAIKGSDAAQKFGLMTANDTTGNAPNIDEVYELLHVQRNDITATEVTANLAHKYTDTGSIHYASVNDPVFFVQEDYLYVKPVHSGSGALRYIYLPQYAVTDYPAASAASSIDHFPAEYYDHVLIYASIKILEAKMHDYIEDVEDSEIAQLIANRVDRLKAQYNEMFGGQE